MRLGVISDTHGLMRPEAMAALAGVDHIIHAGDVGDPAILDRLATLAPVQAVRGNIDRPDRFPQLPAELTLGLAGRTIHVLHDRKDLSVDPAATGIDAVIFGHSHAPSARWEGAVLFLNPGAAGPRRFRLPVTLARLTLGPEPLAREIVPLIETP